MRFEAPVATMKGGGAEGGPWFKMKPTGHNKVRDDATVLDHGTEKLKVGASRRGGVCTELSLSAVVGGDQSTSEDTLLVEWRDRCKARRLRAVESSSMRRMSDSWRWDGSTVELSEVRRVDVKRNERSCQDATGNEDLGMDEGGGEPRSRWMSTYGEELTAHLSRRWKRARPQAGNRCGLWKGRKEGRKEGERVRKEDSEMAGSVERAANLSEICFGLDTRARRVDGDGDDSIASARKGGVSGTHPKPRPSKPHCTRATGTGRGPGSL